MMTSGGGLLPPVSRPAATSRALRAAVSRAYSAAVKRSLDSVSSNPLTTTCGCGVCGGEGAAVSARVQASPPSHEWCSMLACTSRPSTHPSSPPPRARLKLEPQLGKKFAAAGRRRRQHDAPCRQRRRVLQQHRGRATQQMLLAWGGVAPWPQGARLGAQRVQPSPHVMGAPTPAPSHTSTCTVRARCSRDSEGSARCGGAARNACEHAAGSRLQQVNAAPLGVHSHKPSWCAAACGAGQGVRGAAHNPRDRWGGVSRAPPPAFQPSA